MTPDAASDIVRRLSAADPRGIRTESRLLANLRKIGSGMFKPMAMEDEDVASEPVAPACYSPLWAQQAYGEPEDEGFCWSLYRGVAMFEVATALSDRGEYYCGTWYHGYDTLLVGFNQAYSDPRVKAIFCRMRTPGGVASSGFPELLKFIRSIRAASGGKPIHFYCDVACSAGYGIVASGDRVSAGQFAYVGSMGAVWAHEDWSENNKMIGLVIESIEFPEGGEKTAGADWKPLSPMARADFQSEVNQIGTTFLADVAAGRPNLTPEATIALKARVFMADNADPERSALKLGLIDAVETEQEAFNVLLAAIGTPEAAQLPAGSQSGPTANAQETGMFKPKQSQASAVALATPSAAQPLAAETAEAGETQGEEGGVDDDDDDDENEPALSHNEDEGGGASASDAEAIAASAEAEAHPQAALAAVRNGLSLAQFKGMVSSLPSPNATAPSAFERHMARVPALAPDATAAKAATWGGALVANAKGRQG